MGGDTHRRRVERAFTAQAAAFEDPRYNRVFTSEAAWVFERLPRGRDDLVLDVAAGTGHSARQLASSVRTVVAVDATAAMLARGQARAREEGHANIVFMSGDAAALPFLDASFDIAVCRFALHHLEDPSVALAEMRRCLRPGGRLGVADLVADEDPDAARRQNELERWRDPSHVRFLARGRLRALVADAGFADPDLEVRAVQRPLAPWLEQTRTPPEAQARIRERLTGELGGGPGTGFAPSLADGELCFRQTFASCIATRPPDPVSRSGGSVDARSPDAT
jgi:ubiquinone/menaquinone biosynthesis C-methylase UbiE